MKPQYVKKLERIFEKEGLKVNGHEFELEIALQIEQQIAARNDEFEAAVVYQSVTVTAYGDLVDEEGGNIRPSYEGIKFVHNNGKESYHPFRYDQ